MQEKYLINEGIKPETVIKTGSPMKEILNYYMPKIKNQMFFLVLI